LKSIDTGKYLAKLHPVRGESLVDGSPGWESKERLSFRSQITSHISCSCIFVSEFFSFHFQGISRRWRHGIILEWDNGDSSFRCLREVSVDQKKKKDYDNHSST